MASKRMYMEVAAMIEAQPQLVSHDATDMKLRITRELALIFKRDNPRFDAGKFFEAAGHPELTNTQWGLN